MVKVVGLVFGSVSEATDSTVLSPPIRRRSETRGHLSHLYLDDGGGQRLRDDAEQLRGILARFDVEGLNQDVCELEKSARRCLQWQEDQHRQPVEEVVDGRPSKRPETRLRGLDSELAAV